MANSTISMSKIRQILSGSQHPFDSLQERYLTQYRQRVRKLLPPAFLTFHKRM